MGGWAYCVGIAGKARDGAGVGGGVRGEGQGGGWRRPGASRGQGATAAHAAAGAGGRGIGRPCCGAWGWVGGWDGQREEGDSIETAMGKRGDAASSCILFSRRPPHHHRHHPRIDIHMHTGSSSFSWLPPTRATRPVCAHASSTTPKYPRRLEGLKQQPPASSLLNHGQETDPRQHHQPGAATSSSKA